MVKINVTYVLPQCFKKIKSSVACIRILQAPLTALLASKTEMAVEVLRQKYIGGQGETKNS